jgi:hypothetical protein
VISEGIFLAEQVQNKQSRLEVLHSDLTQQQLQLLANQLKVEPTSLITPQVMYQQHLQRQESTVRRLLAMCRKHREQAEDK